MPIDYKLTIEQPNFLSCGSEQHKQITPTSTNDDGDNSPRDAGDMDNKQEVLKKIITRPIVRLDYNPRTFASTIKDDSLNLDLTNPKLLLQDEQYSVNLVKLVKQQNKRLTQELIRSQTELLLTRAKLNRIEQHNLNLNHIIKANQKQFEETIKKLDFTQQDLVNENIQAMQEISQLRLQNSEANELLKQYCTALDSMQSKVRSLAAQVNVYS